MAASSKYSISYDADGDVGSEVEAKNDLLWQALIAGLNRL